jgi:hypothetical protein
LKNSEETSRLQTQSLRKLEDDLMNARTNTPRLELGLTAAKERFRQRESNLINIIASLHGGVAVGTPRRSVVMGHDGPRVVAE